MAKLQLNPAPTFFSDVGIPVAGKGETKVRFEFKHRTRDEFQAWIKTSEERTEVETVLDMVKGWDLEEPCDAANVGLLLQNYMGAAAAILDAYFANLVKGREKN